MQLVDSELSVQRGQRALWMPSLQQASLRPFSQPVFWRLAFWQLFSSRQLFWLALLF